MNHDLKDAPDDLAIEDINFETYLPVRLKKIADLINEIALHVAGEYKNMRFTEIRILAYLMDSTDVPILKLGQDLRVDKAWISRLVRGLGERHFITRERQPDGRTVLVNVTPAGRRTYTEFMKRMLGERRALTRGVDHAAAEALCERLEANLREISEALGVRAS